MRGNCLSSSSSCGACDFSVHEFPSSGRQGRSKGKDGAQSHPLYGILCLPGLDPNTS
jgi:hypothetical protein